MGRGMREYRIPALIRWVCRAAVTVRNGSGGDRQAQAERPQDFSHRRELGIAAGRERLVQVGPTEPGGARQLGHAFCARNVSQRRFEQVGVAIFEYRIEIGGDVFLRLQLLGGTPSTWLR